MFKRQVWSQPVKKIDFFIVREQGSRQQPTEEEAAPASASNCLVPAS